MPLYTAFKIWHNKDFSDTWKIETRHLMTSKIHIKSFQDKKYKFCQYLGYNLKSYFTPSLKICQYPTVFVQNWILSWKRKIFDKINPTFLVFHQNFPFNVYLFSEVWHLCNYSKRWQIYIWDPDISFKISIIVQYLNIY